MAGNVDAPTLLAICTKASRGGANPRSLCGDVLVTLHALGCNSEADVARCWDDLHLQDLYEGRSFSEYLRFLGQEQHRGMGTS